jgi:hypothetical protein
LRAQRLRAGSPGAETEGAGVRLEQERIGYAWLKTALSELPAGFIENELETSL